MTPMIGGGMTFKPGDVAAGERAADDFLRLLREALDNPMTLDEAVAQGLIRVAEEPVSNHKIPPPLPCHSCAHYEGDNRDLDGNWPHSPFACQDCQERWQQMPSNWIARDEEVGYVQAR
jgi:hypothetical protein